MTGGELRTFVQTGLLDGGTINDIFFYQLLNVAKEKIENEREWRILETEDSSKSFSPGDTFETTKALPSDFASDIKLFLVDASNNRVNYSPIPYSERHSYKGVAGRYAIDYVNNVFIITGSVSRAYTAYLIYKKFSDDIASSSSWVFPARFHPILGFLVAEMYKAGVDWDSVNVQQALQNRKDASMLYESMLDWDTRIRTQEMGNVYETQGSYNSDGLPTAEVNGVDLGQM